MEKLHIISVTGCFITVLCPYYLVTDTSNHNAHWNDNFMPYGVSTAIVCGLAIVIGLVVLLVGLVALEWKRSRRSRKSSSGVTLLPMLPHSHLQQQQCLPPDVLDAQTTSADPNNIISRHQTLLQGQGLSYPYEPNVTASERLRRKLWELEEQQQQPIAITPDLSRDIVTPDAIGWRGLYGTNPVLAPASSASYAGADEPCTCSELANQNAANSLRRKSSMPIGQECHYVPHLHVYNKSQTMRTFKDNFSVEFKAPQSYTMTRRNDTDRRPHPPNVDVL